VVKNKLYLGMIICMTLVIGMVLAGCGGDDPGPDSSGTSLTGIWVDDRDNISITYIFTDVPDGVIAGAKVAYWGSNVTAGGTATGTEISIGGTAYTYTVNNNTLTLNGYGTPDASGNATNVVFSRAQGQPGTGVTGIWVSNLASGDAKYTLLIVKSGTAAVLSSVGADWGVFAYTLSSDANTTYIKWGNGNPGAYTKYSDPVSLTIPKPNGGGNDTGLRTLPNF
jgi:hypothetical protein